MIESNDIEKIKEAIEELLRKMTITVLGVDVTLSSAKNQEFESLPVMSLPLSQVESRDSVDISITVEEPQILIGQSGKTLFELQRLLRIILNKKLSRSKSPDKVEDSRQSRNDQGSIIESGFYITLDINDYKKKKIEYVKKIATDSADSVVLTKEKKVLMPMSAYERRIIHTQLAQRQDVITESQGEGVDRCVVISPK